MKAAFFFFPTTMIQLHWLSLITISWPPDYHINKDWNQMRHRPLCSVPPNICMFSRILRNAKCFPGHFVQAFVIWISSEALKASNPHALVHSSPPRINSKEVLAHWCSGCFSDMVSWGSSELCVCNDRFLTTRKQEICVAGTNLTQPRLGLRNQRGHWGE